MIAFFNMAFRNIGRNRRRTMVTIVTIAVGILVIVLIRSFLDGMQSEIIKIATKKMVGDMQIHRIGYEDNVSTNAYNYLVPYDDTLKNQLKQIKDIEEITGRVFAFGIINNQRTQESAGGAILGIDSTRELKTCPRFKDAIQSGVFLDSTLERQPNPGAPVDNDVHEAVGITDDSLSMEEVNLNAKDNPSLSNQVPIDVGYHQIMLTPSLARGLKAELGDEIVLLLEDQYQMKQALVCKFVGTVSFNLPFGGANKQAWIDLTTLQKTLSVEEKAFQVVVSIKESSNLYATQKAVESALQDYWKTNMTANNPKLTINPFYVERWDQIMSSHSDIMTAQNIVSSIIIAFVLLLSSFAIVNTASMTVMERTREIGTLMALGYRRGHITSIFLMESSCIGVIGGLSGTILAVVIIGILNFAGGMAIQFDNMDEPMIIIPQFTAWFLMFIVAISFVAAVLASLVPSIRASRLKPVEALSSI